ncbi:MAG: hypothetical protein K0R58_233 [Ramlibacter sp.]|nr:hypothetical protein [Ramlibacter sp.]
MNVETYQAKVYEPASSPCWSLVADVYITELAMPVDEFKTVANSVRDAAQAFRLVLHKGEHGFVRVSEPVDYAVVLMGRSFSRGIHHCGVYYDGKVLHAQPDGTLHQALASLRDQYPLMEFWVR